MSDLIDRQAALEALFDWEMTYDWDEHCREENPKPVYIVSPSDAIKELPSAQPERKKGKWIEDAETYYRAVNEKGGGVDENTPYFVDDIACSECLTMFSTIENCTELFDYCPNCGADMRGGDDVGDTE